MNIKSNIKILENSKIELSNNQGLDFIFVGKKISFEIRENENVKKSLDYSQTDEGENYIFYNIKTKKEGIFISTIQLENKYLNFSYSIEKTENNYIVEYCWYVEKEDVLPPPKKSGFEKIFGSTTNLSIYIASFLALVLVFNIIVLTFIEKENLENFWTLATHILTCCLGYLFGAKSSEN